MYYMNSDMKEPHMVFIGRWNPFHDGHKTIIEMKRKDKNLPILVLVRDTSFDKTTAEERAENVKRWMIEEAIKGCVMIIPDIEGVYYGRKVGYNVERVDVSDDIAAISGTAIRANQKKNVRR